MRALPEPQGLRRTGTAPYIGGSVAKSQRLLRAEVNAGGYHQLAGSRFRPRSTKVGRHSGFSTSSMRRSGGRRNSVAKAISAYLQANWAPRHKWMPPPND